MLREVEIGNSSPPLSKPQLPQNSEIQPFPLPVLPRPDIPKGGRLAYFMEQWEELTDNKWVLFIIRNRFKIPFNSELLKKRAVERVQKLGIPSFYSRLFLVPKKNGKLRAVIGLSLLNQYINKQHFKMEAVNNGQRLGCLHRSDGCISSCTDTSVILKIPSVRLRTLGLSVHGLTLWNVPKSVDFHKNNGCNSSALTATCHISLPILRRLADKRFDSQSTDLSNKILSSNSTKSRIHTNLKKSDLIQHRNSPS